MVSQMEQMVLQEDRQKVELFISCRSLQDKDILSKSDPYVMMYLQNNQTKQFQLQGKTEIIKDDLNPNFTKSFLIDYIFEQQQQLKFSVWDYDDAQSSDFLGESLVQLGKIVGSKNQTCVVDLKDDKGKYCGKLILRAEKVNYCNDSFFAKISLKNIPDTRWFSSTNAFLKFYRTNENNIPILTHTTQPVVNTVNPIFPQMTIKCQKLCNGEYDLPLKIELFDYRSSGKHEYLGECFFTINEASIQKKKDFQFKNAQTKKNAGTLHFEQAVLVKTPQFIDYIRGGTQLNLVIAIDFTGSNGVPSKPGSLHAIMHGQMNQYQQAIYSVSEILLNYDHDKKIPLYGFGAKPKLPHFTSNQTYHCFPINGFAQNPEVMGLGGIMETYQNFLPYVELSGPTYFNPIIQETVKLASALKDSPDDPYFVLIILTDGAIHDMEATKQTIVQASHLPLSIIIIGVGNDDFSNMHILDGDEGLFDNQGNKAQRDLVQFVAFNQFKGSPALLAEHVLAELPDQLVQYNQLVGKAPKPPQIIDIQQMQVQNVPIVQQKLQENFARGNFLNQFVVDINQQNGQQNLNQGLLQQQQPFQQQQIQPQQQALLSQNAMNFGSQMINQQMIMQNQQPPYNYQQQAQQIPQNYQQQLYPQQPSQYPYQNQVDPQQNNNQQGQQYPSNYNGFQQK